MALIGCAVTVRKGQTMVYRGTVTAGVIVLEGGVQLPDGTPVCVQFAIPGGTATPQGHEPGIPLIARDLARLGQGVRAQDLPSDLSLSHDYYLHGAEKGIDQS